MERAADTGEHAQHIVRRVVALLALAVGLLLASAAPAAAHAELLEAAPERGGVVGEPFDEVRLEFLTPVVDGTIELLDPDDAPVEPDGSTSVDDLVLTRRFDMVPRRGTYEVFATVTSADGDQQDIVYAFRYDGPEQAVERSSGPSWGLPIAIVAVGGAVAAGMYGFARRRPEGRKRTP